MHINRCRVLFYVLLIRGSIKTGENGKGRAFIVEYFAVTLIDQKNQQNSLIFIRVYLFCKRLYDFVSAKRTTFCH